MRRRAARNVGRSQVRADGIAAEVCAALDFKPDKRRGYSTALVNQRFVEDLEELYADARRAKPGFDARLSKLAEATAATARVSYVYGATVVCQPQPMLRPYLIMKLAPGAM